MSAQQIKDQGHGTSKLSRKRLSTSAQLGWSSSENFQRNFSQIRFGKYQFLHENIGLASKVSLR